MAKINLLPWREERRRQLRTEFFSYMGIAALATAGVFLLFYLYIGQLIDYQNSRNKFLEGQIAQLDKKIEEINELEKKKESLIQRMEAVQQLQTNRPVIVHMFDELVTTLPEGVFITEITQKGSVITIKGVARSNARVSNYMRNIEQSEWLMKPKLDVIETRTQDDRRLSNFTLVIQQRKPGADESEEDLEDS
jgi:type IV pilus assembly protein PilN